MTTDRPHSTTNQETLTVAIVDDHRLLVEALDIALSGRGVAVLVPTLDDADRLLEGLIQARPDLVLLDLDLGRFGDGSRLVRPLVETGLRVLMVTAVSDVEQVARAVEEGAVGVVRKDVTLSELVATVIDAAHQREVMAPLDRLRLVDAARLRREQRLAELAPFGHLSGRESDVLLELTQGHAVADIARRSVVSEATVRSQVQSILTKLGVRSQLEAVAAAQRSGWVDRTGSVSPAGSDVGHVHGS